MVALAHPAGTFSSHPLVAHMAELARAVLVKVLLRVLSVPKIVSLADTIGIWRILFVPFLGALVAILVLVILIVA